MRKFIYHERPGALKTREGDAAKDKRIRALERVKRSGFFWRPHRFEKIEEYRRDKRHPARLLRMLLVSEP